MARQTFLGTVTSDYGTIWLLSKREEPRSDGSHFPKTPYRRSLMRYTSKIMPVEDPLTTV